MRRGEKIERYKLKRDGKNKSLNEFFHLLSISSVAKVDAGEMEKLVHRDACICAIISKMTSR